MNRITVMALVLAAAPLLLSAQDADIVEIEYYIDTDPGVGLGTSVILSPSSAQIVDITIPTGTFATGTHVLVVRARDLNDVWSIMESRPFYVTATSIASDASITSMEYFLDTDPGPGNGTAMSISPAATIDLLENISTGSLTEGFHILNIRAQDSDGNRSITESRPFYVSAPDFVSDASLVKMEYFLDTDPGPGSGVDIPFTAGTAVDIVENVPTGALTFGFHVLHVRSQDADGSWSIPESRPFFVTDAGVLSPANITAMEYFFDNDPGYGNGTGIAITPGVSLDLDAIISTTSISEGFHVIHIRAQDEDGVWGLSESRAVFVDGLGQVTRVEYFVDTDPGEGSATPVPVTTAPEIDINVAVPTTSLPEGDHTLGVRVGRVDLWSDVFTVDFSLCTDPVPDFNTDVACVGGVTTFTDNSTNATGGTYRWDFDSDGTEDDATVGNTSFAYAAAGTYMATLTIDRFGCSDVFSATVTVGDVPVSDSGPDQDLCVDFTTMAANAPAAGETGMWSIVSGTATITDATNPGTTVTAIDPGNLTLGWTVTNTTTGCSTTSQTVVISSAGPIVAFSSDIVCEGSETTFTDNSQNATEANYQWDYDSDGTIDDTGNGATSHSYPAAGTYNATLTIESNGCTDSQVIAVTVEPGPVADAGADQDLCVNDALLAGSVPGTGEEGLWTLVSGTATITDPTDPGTTVTSIISYNTVLEWTVTNTVGGCSGSDQMAIVSNQPITTGLVSASLAIGESVNRDVQNTAVANPGDVLTTTIVTGPTKGTAEIGSNGSITYTAAEGTVGADVVVYEVCNQCGHCAANNFEVEIINNPPVITQPPAVVVQPGEAVSLELLGIISDANNNLDLSSLTVVQQPISGATASIDGSYRLIIDYTGVFFSGVDQLTIRACDLSGACADNVILIEVDLPADPPVFVYNALSPNGDGRHDFLELENIEAYPDNHVYIVNRWGVRVYEASGYNNSSVRFEGTGNSGGAKDLPAGTYYYSVDLGKGGDRVTGFLVLK